MLGEVAGLSNIGICCNDGLLRLFRSNAIRSCCRMRIHFGKGFVRPFGGEDAIKVAI